MYTPPAFREDDPVVLAELMRTARLATLVTQTADGMLATPLPLEVEESEGAPQFLLGHLAKANLQWQAPVVGEALAIFMGPDAYITPSWYETKRETGKVVPTWNYAAVHAYGEVEFFTDPKRLLEVVTRLTDAHEGPRSAPWSVDDAPPDYIAAQLKGIVGVRMRITRLQGKLKMSQNRPMADRRGVADGLAGSDRAEERQVSGMIPVE